MKKSCFLFILLILPLNFVFAQEDPAAQPSPDVNEAVAALKTPDTSGSPENEPIAVNNSVIQINPLDTKSSLFSFELRDAQLGDVLRILAHDYKLNLLVDKDVQGKVTATLSSVTLDEALEAIAESQNLALEKRNNIIKVSPNLVTKTFTLKYIEAKNILESSASAAVSESTSGSSAAGGTSAQAVAPGLEAASGESAASSSKKANTVYDLLSDKGIILLGKQPNSVMVIDYPPNLKKVEDYLKAIDRKMTSRFFKLKYLKAADVVGQSSASSTSGASSAAPAATTEGSASSSTTSTSSGSTK